MKNVEILIVEDSLTQAENLRYILESNNYSVQHAIDAEEALGILKQKIPDIIISDVNMPRMNGFEFCAIVKSTPRLLTIPFILLTSLSDRQDITNGKLCRADCFINKPFIEESLLAEIKYLYNNKD